MSQRLSISLRVAASAIGLVALLGSTTTNAQAKGSKVLQADAHWVATVEPHRCRVRHVAVFSDRIHVECSNKIGRIVFFAASSRDPSASMYVQLASLAKSRGRTVAIEFGPSKSNPRGCQSHDCRKIVSMVY